MVFIERGLSLTKEGGFFSFIIPKSLAYSQKWSAGRQYIADKLGCACDTSKAFKEVLLEQMVIVVSQKFVRRPYYEAAFLNEDGLDRKVAISKRISSEADTILLGVTAEELQIFNKMMSSRQFLRDISKTARGLPFQKHLVVGGNGLPIYRGDSIGRYLLRDNLETLCEDHLGKAAKKVAFLQQPKIMSQQIIAHVQNPTDHIVLMSTVDRQGVLTLDTVQNTILTDSRYTLELITALLNSTLWSWYAYRFIFSRAVRTMHFDGYYIGKFPLPDMDAVDCGSRTLAAAISPLVDRITDANARLESTPREQLNERARLSVEIEEMDDEIDDHVYALYGLSKPEIELVTTGCSSAETDSA